MPGKNIKTIALARPEADATATFGGDQVLKNRVARVLLRRKDPVPDLGR